MNKIENFLKELKYSYSENEKIYMEGSCFKIYVILKTLFKDAEPYYSQLDGHWVTKIEDKFYDINGEISKDYIEFKNYEHITDKTILASAYIPTYKGQGVSYSKYEKSW